MYSENAKNEIYLTVDRKPREGLLLMQEIVIAMHLALLPKGEASFMLK